MDDQNIKNNSKFSVRVKEKFKSHKYKNVLVAIGVLILALVIFQAGMFVGFRKASFSYGWGDNYRQTFDGPRGEFGMEMMSGWPTGQGLPGAYGAAGKIISISLPTLVVIGPDNVEKVVLIKDDTLIREFRNVIIATDLQVNDQIVVIGAPNSASQIEAKLIRVMPVGVMTASTTPKQ